MSAMRRPRSRPIAAAAALLALPAEPAWLNQVHGNRSRRPGPARHAARRPARTPRSTTAGGKVCAILVADCLPVLFASRDGARIGAAHAGWRGLAAGVLENTVEALGIPAARAHRLAGAGDLPGAFRSGQRGARTRSSRRTPGRRRISSPNASGRWQADLVALARRRLAALGVTDVHGGELVHLRRSRAASIHSGATARAGAWPRSSGAHPRPAPAAAC